MSQTINNATLEDLAKMLQDQHSRKLDVVAPADKLHMNQGWLMIEGTGAVLTNDGVQQTIGSYLPTKVCDEGLADKLQIPLPYLRKMREDHVDLLDANVNGWLERSGKSYLVRCFRDDSPGMEGTGIARAFLSQSYKMIDNLDVLTASLDGVRQAGVKVDITRCDLTERKMYVKLNAPECTAFATDLLKGYRSPFTGRQGPHGEPEGGPGVVSAGLVISNSETGGGAFTIVPQITVLVCRNGLTMTHDALRAVHLGGKQEDGVVKVGQDTLAKELEIVSLRARDAVATFLDTDYVIKAVARLEEKSSTPIETKSVETVCNKLKFSEAVTAGVLDHFIKGGQITAGGVMQSVSSYAQEVEDADLAHELEAMCVQAMDIAAAI